MFLNALKAEYINISMVVPQAFYKGLTFMMHSNGLMNIKRTLF
jgi:hypothetical protein